MGIVFWKSNADQESYMCYVNVNVSEVGLCLWLRLVARGVSVSECPLSGCLLFSF